MQSLPFTHAPLSNKVYKPGSALRVTWALVCYSQALSPRYGLGRRETRCGNRCDGASLGNTPLRFSLLCLQVLTTRAVIAPAASPPTLSPAHSNALTLTRGTPLGVLQCDSIAKLNYKSQDFLT